MPEQAETVSVLGTCAAEVLETMFFTATSGSSEPSCDASPGALTARVRFAGAPSGVFTLVVDEAAARGIAGNFLGVDDDSRLSGEDIKDTVRELANIICGSVLSRMEATALFDIDAPEIVPAAEPLPSATAGKCQLDVAGGSLTLLLDFEATEAE